MTEKTKCPECYLFEVERGRCNACPYREKKAEPKAKEKGK